MLSFRSSMRLLAILFVISWSKWVIISILLAERIFVVIGTGTLLLGGLFFKRIELRNDIGRILSEIFTDFKGIVQITQGTLRITNLHTNATLEVSRVANLSTV